MPQNRDNPGRTLYKDNNPGGVFYAHRADDCKTLHDHYGPAREFHVPERPGKNPPDGENLWTTLLERKEFHVPVYPGKNLPDCEILWTNLPERRVGRQPPAGPAGTGSIEKWH